MPPLGADRAVARQRRDAVDALASVQGPSRAEPDGDVGLGGRHRRDVDDRLAPLGEAHLGEQLGAHAVAGARDAVDGERRVVDEPEAASGVVGAVSG